MTAKPVVLSDRARDEFFQAIAHYIAQASQSVANDFAEALEQTLARAGDYPASGSPAYAQAMNIADLRSWPVSGFPYLVFTVEREDKVDVLRILHTATDIPASLRGLGED